MTRRKQIIEDPSIKKLNKDRNDDLGANSFNSRLLIAGVIFGFLATPFLFLSIPITIGAWLAISILWAYAGHKTPKANKEESYCQTTPMLAAMLTTPSVDAQTSHQMHHEIFFTPKTANKSTQTISEIGTQTISEIGTQTISEIGTQTISEIGTQTISEIGTHTVSEINTQNSISDIEILSVSDDTLTLSDIDTQAAYENDTQTVSEISVQTTQNPRIVIHLI